MIKKLKVLAAQALLLTSTAGLYLGLTNTAQALPFNKISKLYFFGDSLTDSGFNDYWDFFFPLPTGKAPTFTTYGGYIWSQYLSRDIKGYILPQYPAVGYPLPNPPDVITNNTTPLIPGTWPVSHLLTGFDYAAAGSTTNSIGVGEIWAPSLHTQIQHFLATTPRPLDPNALYFIWSGANDFLALLQGPPPTQLQLLQAANTAATNIAAEVALLSAYGARRVVVISLPNLGITPLITQIAASTNMPTLPAQMKSLSFTFNSMLNQKLGAVITTFPVKVLYVDVYDLINNVIIATQAGRPFMVAGQAFKFVNYTTPACGNVPQAIFCPPGTPNGYVFADTIHPTDMAHRLLSLQIETLIQAWV